MEGVWWRLWLPSGSWLCFGCRCWSSDAPPNYGSVTQSVEFYSVKGYCCWMPLVVGSSPITPIFLTRVPRVQGVFEGVYKNVSALSHGVETVSTGIENRNGHAGTWVRLSPTPPSIPLIHTLGRGSLSDKVWCLGRGCQLRDKSGKRSTIPLNYINAFIYLRSNPLLKLLKGWF